MQKLGVLKSLLFRYVVLSSKMKIYFSPRITLIGLALIAGMLRLAYWQWERHLSKQVYIADLQNRLNEPIINLDVLSASLGGDWSKSNFRRVRVGGVYDFDREIALRNRKFEDSPGFHFITPLKTKDGGVILVDRGFVPLNFLEKSFWPRFRSNAPTSFVGLIKESMTPKPLSPADPMPSPEAPLEAWLRVEIPKIQKQLPYPILPVYVEIMSTTEPDAAQKLIVNQKSDRDDVFLPTKLNVVQTPESAPSGQYPLPSFDTVAPPGRHLGYVWEWSFMALMTFLICFGLQLRPPRNQRNSEPAPSR